MTVGQVIDHRPVPAVADDGVRCQVCDAVLYPVGEGWSHTDPGPPNHLAALGLPEGFGIQHPSGECAWCDAMRWREMLRHPEAGRPDAVLRMLRLGA